MRAEHNFPSPLSSAKTTASVHAVESVHLRLSVRVRLSRAPNLCITGMQHEQEMFFLAAEVLGFFVITA
jgi:xanthine dehydrogenase molybdopterin-binding subunit B